MTIKKEVKDNLIFYLIVGLMCFIIFFIPTQLVFSGNVTLTWKKSTSEDVVMYKIYQSNKSGTYGQAVATVPSDKTTIVLPNIVDDIVFYWVVTAVDSGGKESLKSNEVNDFWVVFFKKLFGG